MAELLLSKGYEVHGIVRRASSSNNLARIQHLHDVRLHYGDMTDGSGLNAIVAAVRPDEIYNLAAQSDVGLSYDMSEYTTDVNSMGTLRLLNAIRSNKKLKSTRFYQASTWDMYGKVTGKKQDENTVLHPQSPYGMHRYDTTSNHFNFLFITLFPQLVPNCTPSGR